MQLPLEDLDYQRRAIAAVVGVFEGQVRNTFDNSNLFGIQANITDLTPSQIDENKKRIAVENGIPDADAKLSPDCDICIEMETGTGKTIVYLRTIFELHHHYQLTKFIILVPSIAIREGILSTWEKFKNPLAERYGFTPVCFDYDSSRLSRLRRFIEDTQPQIMVMTIQSITAENRIINQQGRDDSFLGMTYLQSHKLGPKPRGHKPTLSGPELVMGLVFHVLTAAGTLAAHVRKLTGISLSNSALSQRRAAAGVEPFDAIAREVLRPLADPQKHPQAFYKGLRLGAVDGSQFNVSNTPTILSRLDKAKSRRMQAAFAKVPMNWMMEVGTHAPVVAVVGLEQESEWVLAQRLLERIQAPWLIMMD